MYFLTPSDYDHTVYSIVGERAFLEYRARKSEQIRAGANYDMPEYRVYIEYRVVKSPRGQQKYYDSTIVLVLVASTSS
jgi:hypothetical protein